MNTPLLRLAPLLIATTFAAPAQAQILDLLKSLVPNAAGTPAKAADAAEAAASAPTNTLSTLNSKTVAGAVAKAKAVTDLGPDRQCNRPQEKFNIAEKLMEYGGTEATLRLERLIGSDFEYNDLTPADRELLRYLAQNTVWVPAELESKLGGVFDLAPSSGEPLTPLDEGVFKDVEAQLGRFRALTTDFPAEIRLRHNPELPDGAFAKFGGIIQISTNMLHTVSQRPVGADLLLAHELAHVYKRHAIKRMQFELLSSRDGWELAKKLLQRAQRGASFDPLRDGWFAITVVPPLITFVRSLQLKFSSEQELEADACAANWLKAAGLNPTQAWNEFRDGIAASAASANEQGYGRTHPPTAEREANFVVKVQAKSGGKNEVKTGTKPGDKPSNGATQASPGTAGVNSKSRHKPPGGG